MKILIREELKNPIEGFKAFEGLVDFEFLDTDTSDFEKPNETTDQILSGHVDDIKKLINGNNNILFVPTILNSKASLSYIGARLAMHIRFDNDKKINRLPIVLMGVESLSSFVKNCKYSDLLKTKKCYYINLSIQSVEEFINDKSFASKAQALTDNEYQKAIKKIHLTPPSNYASHHSIDNELALLRWSKYLKLLTPEDKLPENEKKVEKEKKERKNLATGLYFKYHRALHPVKPPKEGNPIAFLDKKNTPLKANILLIDDEANKGWKDFYENFFENSPNIDFDYLDIDFKAIGQKEIQEESKQKIDEYNPDVVLLDLRLHDADFKNDIKPKNLTGYKILEEIKKINRGIQVIITTASNKVWNYESLMNAGANGYIIKSGNSDVLEDIQNLKNVIEKGVEKAGYLKSVFYQIKELTSNINNVINEENLDKFFGNELIKYMGLSFRMIENANDKTGFAFAYLSLFKCLELINDFYIYKDENRWKIKNSENLKQFKWNNIEKHYYDNNPPNFNNNIPTTFEKIAGLSFQLCNFDDNFVKNIYFSIKRRNEFIHPSESDLSADLKKEIEKIYEPEGFQILMKQLFEIIKNLVIKQLFTK